MLVLEGSMAESCSPTLSSLSSTPERSSPSASTSGPSNKAVSNMSKEGDSRNSFLSQQDGDLEM